MTSAEQVKDLYDRAKQLAYRWIKAWGVGYQHGWPEGLTFQVDERDRLRRGPVGTIWFSAQPDSGGVGLWCSIPLSYLDDSTTLEADSRAWYKAEGERRNREHHRKTILEATPEVVEYRRLTQSTLSL